ncbi:MAG: sigma-70 family RNA polymerase sigma factor [Candidatus Gastranaerophilaceae bacterium]
MQSKQAVNIKNYKELIETVAKVEYQKLCAVHLIEYLELVNIGTQTLYSLFKDNNPEKFNKSYLATAIKWAVRNEVRRRYRWYSLKHRKNAEEHEDLREAVYKTILSIDEIAGPESPTQLKDDGKNPEESMEFVELRGVIIEAIRKLPLRERELIESKFFGDKKLKEISTEFDLSPSRVSRIIQSGLNRIKKDLGKRSDV